MDDAIHEPWPFMEASLNEATFLCRKSLQAYKHSCASQAHPIDVIPGTRGTQEDVEGKPSHKEKDTNVGGT